MRDVLVYLTDSQSADDVQYLFAGKHYQVTIVENQEDVIAACQQELFDFVMIWPAPLDQASAVMDSLTENQFHYMPVIAIIKEDESRSPFYELPLADLIQLPIKNDALFNVIEGMVEDSDTETTIEEGMNWQGSIEEYSLIDLIQMVETGNRDAELNINYDTVSAQLLFHAGNLISASFNDHQGLAALKKVTFWPKGYFQTKLTEQSATENRIGMTNQEVLLALAESAVKQEQLYQGLPDPFEAVMINPLVEPPEKLTPLQKRIAGICKKPLTIWALLMEMPDNNEDIMLELKIMIQQGLIDDRQTVETAIREAEGQTGIGKFFSSISSMFKKKEEEIDLSMYYEYYDEMTAENLQPTLEVNPLQLHRKELDKIERKLNGIAE